MDNNALLRPDPRNLLAGLDTRLGRLERRIDPDKAKPAPRPKSAFVTVAAVDTPEMLALAATFRCDGVADQAEIQAATAAAEGGTVHLLPGTFELTAPVELAGSLVGSGAGSTRVRYRAAADAAFMSGGSARIAHLQIEVPFPHLGSAIIGNDSDLIEDVTAIAGSDPRLNALIRLGDDTTIRGCYLESYGGLGIDANLVGNARIIGNTIHCATGIVVYQATAFIAYNQIGSSANPGGSLLATDPNFSDAVGCGIAIIQGLNNPSVIIGNQIDGGIPSHGILVAESRYLTITGNRIAFFGQQATGSYSGIHIRTLSDHNLVQTNRIAEGTGINDDYGIRIDDSTCYNNFVTNNDLDGSWGIADFSDAGTNTITQPGNNPGGLSLTDADIPATIARDAEVATAVSDHAATPHGGTHPDLAAHDALGLVTQTELDTHADDTTSVHGVADMAVLATDAEVAAAVAAHEAAANPHATYLTQPEGDALYEPLGGGGGGATAMVPYYIGVGETFTVPEFHQALYVEPIELDGGTLDVEGLLIEVAQPPDLSALVHMSGA